MVPGIALSILLPQVFAVIRAKWKKCGFVLRFLGKCSLELYLLHIMGRGLLPKTTFYNKQNVLHYYLMLAASVLLAYPAHKLVEFVSLRLGKTAGKLREGLTPSSGR